MSLQVNASSVAFVVFEIGIEKYSNCNDLERYYDRNWKMRPWTIFIIVNTLFFTFSENVIIFIF